MFVSYFEISISVIVRIIRAFCLPGGLIPFSSAWETEKIAGFWFARTGGEMSTQIDTMINCENMHMSARIPSN